MTIDSLSLENFRSYSKKNVSFAPGVTFIVGPNASGKTNLLEAIHMLSTAKSFRADKDQDVIRFGSELGRIKAEIHNNNSKTTDEKKRLEIVVTTGLVGGIKTPFKKLILNGIPKRTVDFAGNVKTVLFWPQHLDIVTDSPSIRRKYLDAVMMQLDRVYRRCLNIYEKGLRQRNRLLEAIREHQAGRNQLEYWDNLLIENGSYLSQKRQQFIDFANVGKKTREEKNLPAFNLIYDKSEISQERLAQYRYEETASATTLVGPHRDNVIFLIKENGNRRILSDFGSRGEQRLAVLWLSLRELAFIEDKSQEKPILLLDDILSELDEDHRSLVMSLIESQQTIITTIDRQLIDNYSLPNKQVISLT